MTANDPSVVQLIEVSLRYNKTCAVDAVTLDIPANRMVGLIGPDGVGKSSLLNKLTKSDRSVVDNVAGTTVDPVDELVQLDENLWTFIDTAGLRKKVKNAQGHEYYASLRTRSALDAAEDKSPEQQRAEAAALEARLFPPGE